MEGEVEVLNDVMLNQVLVAFGDDETTAAVIADLQAEGTSWVGGTRWHDRGALRISVSNWSTTEARHRPQRGEAHPQRVLG